MELQEILEYSLQTKASDIHLTVGLGPMLRIDGELKEFGDRKLTPEDLKLLAKEIMTEEQLVSFNEHLDLDFAYAMGKHRFRTNVYTQKGYYAISIRTINDSVPHMEELGLPEIFKTLVSKRKGLILVTGPTGSGKSTTLAAMIDYINRNAKRHIITLEDPVEFIHYHGKSMINQREVGRDVPNFNRGLRGALRQDPDVILVGEMRDADTIATTITAAETGHLVFSTLHTNGAANTIDRIIDSFPPHQQPQVRTQLSGVVEGVISQQLISRTDGRGRVAALEIMTATNAIRNLIREGKIFQITSTMQTGAKFGMVTMASALEKLVREGTIAQTEAQRIMATF
ncbi:MAG: type IV pili twitching motility protein PilT [delta proteobacterium ML8_F1]|nr:MAG: type IV pili twitching motility protein PilT [delta proteobacterium ML8_F1]